MITSKEERAKWKSDAENVCDTPWSFLDTVGSQSIMDSEGGTLISIDFGGDGEVICGTDEMRHIANSNPAHFLLLLSDLEELQKERDELQASADLHSRMMKRARKMWQSAHPEITDRWPDGADNVVWLIEQLDAAWDHLPCPGCGRTNARCKCEPGDDGDSAICETCGKSYLVEHGCPCGCSDDANEDKAE